jgi:hypothetical protein
MAVLAAEKDSLEEARKINSNIPEAEQDKVGLTRMLSEGSQLCKQLENMVSFLVTTEVAKKRTAASLNPGEQLCALAVKCAPVSQGIALWAREITKSSDFVISASYPTISISIMSLIHIVYLHHPITRDNTYHVAFEFLKHNNSEIAYQMSNTIKEQSLRRHIFLCVRGKASIVLEKMTYLLKDTSKTHLDASLIRYFVSGLVEVASPPFSIPFIRSLGLLEVPSPPFSIPFIRSLIDLLKTPACADAVKASYFDEASKKRLNTVFDYMKKSIDGGHPFAKQYVSHIKSVISFYRV